VVNHPPVGGFQIKFCGKSPPIWKPLEIEELLNSSIKFGITLKKISPPCKKMLAHPLKITNL
jgi:hypothetical protein